MPASPPDEAQQTEARGIGGLAGVLRGLTGSKKSSTPQQSLGNSSSTFPPDEAAVASSAHGLPPEHLDAFHQLSDGSISERVAAAHALRFAVADYPLAPVRVSGK